MQTEPLLSCERLVRLYDTASGRVQAVRGVDLDLHAGVTTAVVGPSGSGKSSLLRMLSGLDRPSAGTVVLDGIDLWSVSERERSRLRSTVITSVAQRPSDNLFEHLTTRQQLRRRTRSDETVDEWLTLMDLEHRQAHRPATMSGGERQRLAFARAAVAGHRVVIADEPTSQLDEQSTAHVMDAIDLLAERGTTVLVATHDRRVLERVADVVELRDGAVATVTSAGSALSVIDRSGRLQLPPELRDRFPARRVRIVWDEASNRIELEEP